LAFREGKFVSYPRCSTDFVWIDFVCVGRDPKVLERDVLDLRTEGDLGSVDDLALVVVVFDRLSGVIDGDGIEEDLVVIWHQKAREILRATYNPYLHGRRPFSSAPYIPGPGFYGVGIGEADEWAQIIMSRLLNAAVDNTLLANQRMYSVPLGSNISPDEPIYRGKIWPLGPNEKIGEVRLGEVYPSLGQLMGNMMQWAEQRTSVSER